MNRHLKESQNEYVKYKHTILTRRLCICFACCLYLFLSSFVVNPTTTKNVNFYEWFESLESFMSIIRFFKIYESKWVGVWIKHISNVISLMSTLYLYSLQPVLINKCCSEYKWIKVVELQYNFLTHTQIFMSTYE